VTYLLEEASFSFKTRLLGDGRVDEGGRIDRGEARLCCDGRVQGDARVRRSLVPAHPSTILLKPVTTSLDEGYL
jgi:hypothetical protein